VIFKIKICGLTSVADALAAVDAGADAIGLNFYSGSRRRVSVDMARQIVDAICRRAECVGVFVNASAEEIQAICEQARLHIVQLHGNEPPEFIQSWGSAFDVIRARRLDERGTPAIRADLEACIKIAGCAPAAILIDAAASGQFGGTGQTVDWRQLESYEAWIKGVPLILAGGLTPANVAEAIRIVGPQAVDTASGVESAPGEKDTAKMRDFVAVARAAFAAL
jgi:phosphoribosylanthranilate isomerase